MTAQEIFNMTMDLIDERLSTGSISEADTIEYKVKAPSILTMGQAELLKLADIRKTYQISRSPFHNVLGSGFYLKEFKGEDIVFQGVAKAYYFEVDGDCTVFIEELDGTLIEQIEMTDISCFTSHKGTINSDNEIRIRFSGTYYYRIKNVALFNVNFSIDRIPDYRPWVKYEMPSDFKTVDQIINEYSSTYQKGIYTWEGNDLYVDYYYTGNIRINYRPIPTKITALTQELEIDDITATMALPYFLASHLMVEENSDLASFYNERYEDLKKQLKKKAPANEEPIIDVWRGFDG